MVTAADVQNRGQRSERDRNDREGSMLNIEFTMKNGRQVTLTGIGIRVFDALRQMKPGAFDKRFIWGDNTGVAVEEISSWIILQQYDE